MHEKSKYSWKRKWTSYNLKDKCDEIKSSSNENDVFKKEMETKINDLIYRNEELTAKNDHLLPEIEFIKSESSRDKYHSYGCPYCGKKFESNSILKEHIRNHKGPNKLQFKSSDSEESDWETEDE